MNWAVGALLVLAMVLANLPFLSERLFLAWPLKSGRKTLPWRLAELVGLYFVTGTVAYWMEGRLGPVYTQKWEFYAVTACLFIVFAYPGFVYCYLWRRRGP